MARRARLRDMTLGQLLERYHAIVSEEVRPDTLDTWRTSRRYLARMAAVQKELRSRTLEEWLANIDDEYRSDPETAERAAARMRWIYVDNGRYEPQPPPPRVAGLRELTADELVQRFVALAIEEDETTEGFEDVDRIYWLIDEVLLELDARSSDERRILLPLLTHPHIAVRARAADAVGEIAPDLSRSRSLAIDDPEWSPELDASGLPKGEARRRGKLAAMSVEELVERFAEIGVEQYEAEMRDEIPRFNRLYGLKGAIADELQGRPGDQRLALLRLYRHPNIQVRLNVAHATLVVAPANARALLEAIRDSHWMPQAANAGMSLSALDRGEYKPT